MGKTGNGKKLKGSAVVSVAVPPVAAYASRTAWETAVWDMFITHLAHGKEKAEIDTFLSYLITATERRVVVHRIAATDRILAGKKYRDIAEELWLSPQTVSSIKKSLEESSYRSYRERGRTERKKKLYSSGPKRPSQKRDPSKRIVRTKYGNIYVDR